MKSLKLNTKNKYISSIKLEENLKVYSKDITNNIIYFLLDINNIVVYVGKSTQGLARIGKHIADNTKEFISYAYLIIPDIDKLDLLESYFIAKYNPKYNICLGKYNIMVPCITYEPNKSVFITEDTQVAYSLTAADLKLAEQYLAEIYE